MMKILRHARLSTVCYAALACVLTGDVWSAEKQPQTVPETKSSVTLAQQLPGVAKLLWLDCEADILSLDTEAEVEAVIQKSADAGFNVIVLDTKNMMGMFFYKKTKIGKSPQSWKGKPYPQDFDLLEVVVRECKKRNMQIYTGLNLFGEGAGPTHHEGRSGPAMEHPEWQAVGYETVAVLKGVDGTTVPLNNSNDRAGRGISAFNAADGRGAVCANYAPQNVVDGVLGKGGSRWASKNTTGTEELVFSWPEPVSLSSVKIHFIRGFPIRNFKVTAANGDILAEKKDNAALAVSFVNLNGNTKTSTVTLTFGNGAEQAAPIRVDEVTLTDVSGKNLGKTAKVTASSVLSKGTGVLSAFDASGKLLSTCQEGELSQEWLTVPVGGYVLVGEDKAGAQKIQEMAAHGALELTTATVMAPEGMWENNLLLYVNPSNPDVQKRQLDVIDELLANYDINGVILDRGRYDNFKVDFSDLSRRQFEEDTHQKVKNWPTDIYVPANPLTGAELEKGPLYKQWIAWRAGVIRRFMERAAKQIHEKHPGKVFGDYVGGWYGEYWAVGVNWGAASYDATADYDWATREWNEQGYAQILDFLSPGLYYSQVLKSDGEPDKPNDTVEGGIELVNKVTNFSTRIVPGLYAPNVTSDEDWERAIRLCIEKTSGVMIFSQTSLDSSKRWDATRRGLEATPQHLE